MERHSGESTRVASDSFETGEGAVVAAELVVAWGPPAGGDAATTTTGVLSALAQPNKRIIPESPRHHVTGSTFDESGARAK